MSNESRVIGISFGVLNPPIKDQLRKQGFFISCKDSAKCEKMRNAITMLRIFGIATTSEAGKMYKRLLKVITECAKEMKHHD